MSATVPETWTKCVFTLYVN